MKTRKRKRIERIAIWLMTVIVAINYSVTIALAAEGIGQEELPEKETSSEVATVQVQVNPDALVDAAIYQTNSGVRPLDGVLPVGAVTVHEIPVLASVSLSVDAETFAEKCAALQVEQYDPAWAFDAGYRSALRQNEATAFAWQEAAAMLNGVAVLNDSDQLVTLIVVPVQTGEEVALAPEEAVLVAGEPLEAELSGETQTPADESGADQDETSGSQDETETADPSEETSSDDAAGESSSEEESQEPPEEGETEESEPSSSEEQPTEEEDFSDEEDATEGADGMDEEEPADEGEGMDEEESEPEPQDEPQEEDESEPESDPEPEETGEGSVEANAGREGHVVFYETAGDDAELNVDQGFDEPTERQEEPKEQNEPEEPAPQPEQPADDGQDAPQESDAPETDGADEPENGTQTGETEPLPEEAIQQSESSVVVMNARPMGGVMMSFRAAAPMSTTNGITVNGQLTSETGWNAEFYWYAKRDGKLFYPKGFVDKNFSWNGFGPFEATSDSLFIPYPNSTSAKSKEQTFFLVQVPPDGYAAFDTAVFSVVLGGNRPQNFQSDAGATFENGTLTLPTPDKGDAFKQYKVTSGGMMGNIVLEDASGTKQNVYCYNQHLAMPTNRLNVRYILDGKMKPTDEVIRAMQFGDPGRALYQYDSSSTASDSMLRLGTQWAIWYLLDGPGTISPLGTQLVNMAKDETYQPDFGDANVSLSVDDKSNAGIVFSQENNELRSPIITLSGRWDLCVVNLPTGVEAFFADGTKIEKIEDHIYLTGNEFYLSATDELVLSNAKLEVRAVKTKFTPVDSAQFYKTASSLVTMSAESEGGTSNSPGKKFQDLVGYGASKETNTKTVTLNLYSPSVTPVNLILKKIAAEKNDDGTDKLLEGAEFTLRWYDKNAWVPVNDENNPLKTGQDGQVMMANLSLDVPYELTEITPPDGYNKLASPVTFMLSKENNVISVYQVNEDMTRGGLWTTDAQSISVEGLTMTVPNVKLDPIKSQLTLRKIAAEKNAGEADELLANAVFTLEKYENPDWKFVNSGENALVTGQEGLVTMVDLFLGVPYRLTETTPPDGYNKLESPVLFMLAEDNAATNVYQVKQDQNGVMTRGDLWATDAQGISVTGLTMTVPNVKPEEPVKNLKLHLDHLVQEGYNSAYDNLVNGTDFQFALVRDGAVVATGVSHGQKDNVTWSIPEARPVLLAASSDEPQNNVSLSNGGETVDISEGTYYLFGYNVEQPFQRVVHVYQEARNADGQAFESTFAGTAEASSGELREAASLVGGTPFMGVRINVTDADMTAYNGGTLYYHAESNLSMGRLTVNKTYYNRTYRSANDEFQFEVRKLGSRTDTFDQGTYYQTVTVRAGDGKQEINLPYGIYAIRETGMPSRYSFNLFASGAGVTYNPAENFARFSFPRSLLDEGAVNPANEWQVTVTAENRVHSNDRDDDDDDDDNYRSDGNEEGGGGGGGGSDPGRSLFNHDDLVNIPEEAVPLTDKPLVEIPDEDVPLGALPNTGGFSMGVFAVLGAAITAIGVFLRKGKKSEA